MKLTHIALGEEGDPVEVTARMSLAEVAYLVRSLGRMSPAQYEEAAPGLGRHASGVYDALNQVLLRFYDEGVDDPELREAVARSSG